MTMNRLAGSTSPYLRQHAENPVDWWPWIPEAFAEAKRRNVPVHLSIGYAACHWCHVMARESFSDPATAEQLNHDFVSIKVDREERPEVDHIYMRALQALGEHGGWPLTMFLTPDAEPFWGGTYFPPEPRWGRPSFRQVLTGVSGAWQAGDAAISTNANALRDHLRKSSAGASAGNSPDVALLDVAAKNILAIWDMQRGSFRGAPKFPNPVVLEALWRSHLRTGDPVARAAVLTTLRHLCQGGVYDHLGGGFARYSVDAAWLVPHFEKMLYDNGLLLSALSLAYRETGDALFRARIEETIDWLGREMTMPGGAFASSLDADTDHEEGLTYVWDWEELESVLRSDLPDFAALYGATRAGNWEGKIILNRLAPDAFEWLGEAPERRLRELRAKLLRVRNGRPQPARDDKVLADWNGLAITGLAQAARATSSEKARSMAESVFCFVAESMSRGDRLAHSFMEGSLVYPGIATDYAAMIRAALDLFALTSKADYLSRAETWFRVAEKHHFDTKSQAYRLVADDGLALIASALSVSDEATPAATGVMAHNAAMLFMLTGDRAYRDRAEGTLRQLESRVSADVVGSASLQSAFDTTLRGRLAFVVGQRDTAAPLVDAALAEADPALLLASPEDAPAGDRHPAAGKRPRGGEAALFLCDAFRCLPEVVSPTEAAKALWETRTGLIEANPMPAELGNHRVDNEGEEPGGG
jgi:uncharacterized protein YyaL (SSP411 family)